MSVVAPNISLATEEGEAMNRRQRVMSIGTALGLIALTAYAPAWRLLAQSPPVALRGHVSSDTEPAMEGVIVTAKDSGATIATSVVTDARGDFQFMASRLAPGSYGLRIRAAGYDLTGPSTVTVAAGKAAVADLALEKTKNLTAQLTNAEWLASFPGTDAQKADIRGCAHCHSLELITRSRHTAAEFVKVVERMSGYPPLAFPLKPQRTPSPRIGGGEVSRERQLQSWQRQADYLATLNLSGGNGLTYALKTEPRPKGAATRVIYTTYDLPKPTRQPHDVIVDSQGFVWYASFGEQILGKLDPRTGTVTEYEIPILKPDAPTGILGMRFDRDENPWLAMQFQGGIAKFDRHTEKFQTWRLPPELNGPHVQVNQVSPERSHIDGKVWLQDAGTYTVMRLDIATGTFERFEPYKIPRPNVYDVIPDSHNNGFFLTMGAEEVGRIDAKTGQIQIFKTPTKGSGPRRGMMDDQDRLWFGENRSDKIGMFDTKTQAFREWAPTPGGWPYDVTIDKNGEVWSGGEYNDRIVRLNPQTGTLTEYLMPGHTNVRRVWVDNKTTPVTFWVGSNHAASIVRLEPLESRVAGR
jgi:streptogramin lyase